MVSKDIKKRIITILIILLLYSLISSWILRIGSLYDFPVLTIIIFLPIIILGTIFTKKHIVSDQISYLFATMFLGHLVFILLLSLFFIVPIHHTAGLFISASFPTFYITILRARLGNGHIRIAFIN